MPNFLRTETTSLEIRVVKHRGSDLLMAYSPDLEGLLVPGRSHQELEDRIPGAIREIFEAMGRHVESISPIREDGETPVGFEAFHYRADAQLMVA